MRASREWCVTALRSRTITRPVRATAGPAAPRQSHKPSSPIRYTPRSSRQLHISWHWHCLTQQFAGRGTNRLLELILLSSHGRERGLSDTTGPEQVYSALFVTNAKGVPYLRRMTNDSSHLFPQPASSGPLLSSARGSMPSAGTVRAART
jgi:hypothetical protein